jgi:hypothetical protein
MRQVVVTKVLGDKVIIIGASLISDDPEQAKRDVERILEPQVMV